MVIRFNRRNFLRGLGGTLIALPTLEYFFDKKAYAAPAQSRMVVMFGGMSSGNNLENSLTPEDAAGGTYATNGVYAPLETRGVTGKVAVVSNLYIPRGRGYGPAADAGGMSLHWHCTSMGPLISGSRYQIAPGGGSCTAPGSPDTFDCVQLASPIPTGTTADNLLLEQWGGSGLNYRVQVSALPPDNTQGIMSWRKGPGGMQGNDPVTNLQVAFNELVGRIAPDDPDARKEFVRNQARKKKAVDLAIGRRELLGRVGSSDKQRLEQHFDELQALESRLNASSPQGNTCVAPNTPPNDMSEKQRGDYFVQLIKTAFSCNQTRTATMLLTYAQSFLPMQNLGINSNDDIHATGHGPDSETKQPIHRAALSWHIDVFAQLVKSLSDTDDAGGGKLIDSTGVVLLFEGGGGWDPEEDPNFGNKFHAHSSQNMVVLAGGLAAGNAGSKKVDGNKAHPASVTLTAMKNAGYNGNTLGEISATIAAIKK
jgi:hypothetical protein